MVRHIILWKLKDIGDKKSVKSGIKSGLEGLKGKIPGLLDIRVNTEGLSSSNADVMLDSSFESEAALRGYSVFAVLSHLCPMNGGRNICTCLPVVHSRARKMSAMKGNLFGCRKKSY